MSHFTLPEGLTAKLRAYERKLWQTETLLVVGAMGAGICGAFLLLFLSDRLWDTPLFIRIALLLLMLGSISWGLWSWGRKWLWHKRSAIDLAKMVQQRHRGLGDHLQGIIELTTGNADAEMSPELCKAAIRQVAGECEPYDFGEAVERKHARSAILGWGALLVPLLALGILVPDAARSLLTRLVVPWSDTQRFTFATLEPLPKELVVLHGEPYELPVQLTTNSRWKPGKAVARVGSLPAVETRLTDGQGRFNMPASTRSGMLTVSVGDTSATLDLLVVHRPALEALTARITLPDYLQRKAQETLVESDTLRVLEGGQVVVSGTVTRELASASLTNSGADTQTAMKVTGTTFASDPVTYQGETRIELGWTDTYGFTPRKERYLNIIVEADEAPVVQCLGLGSVVALLEDEALEIEVLATDDYGVQATHLTWSVVKRGDKEAVGEPGNVLVQGGAPMATDLTGTYVFSPAALNIPPLTMVMLRARTNDYLPGREPVDGSLHRLLILSRAEHAELIRDQFEQIQAGVEELVRSEEGLKAGKEEMTQMSDAELASDAANEKLEEQELAEAGNRDELEALRKEMMELMQEAMRNRDMPTEMFAEWAQMMETMKEVSQQDMPPMMQDMQQAQQASQSNEKKKEIEEAIAKQKEVLEKLQKLVEQMGESMESMQIRNFVARLREAAASEDGITKALQRVMGDLIGLDWESLPDDLKQVLQKQVKAQLGVQSEAENILTDLIGFNTRTQNQTYLAIQESMRETGVPEKLDDPAEDIQANRVAQAMQLTNWWSSKFTEWADLLEVLNDQKKDDSDGDGDPVEMDMEMVMALLRLLQEEMTIRNSTRALEKGKEKMPDYVAKAEALGLRQLEAYQDLGKLEAMINAKQLNGFFQKVGLAMVDAGIFLKEPRTDAEPIGAETEAIEMLAALISQSSQQMSSQAQMAAMMQMMMGGSGGGNAGGGETDKPSAPISGATNKVEGDAGDPDRSSGTAPARLPTEFREALERYYRNVEKLEP